MSASVESDAQVAGSPFQKLLQVYAKHLEPVYRTMDKVINFLYIRFDRIDKPTMFLCVIVSTRRPYDS